MAYINKWPVASSTTVTQVQCGSWYSTFLQQGLYM